MEQLKFCKFAILSLIVLNLAVLAFFLFVKPKPPHRPPPGQDMRSELIAVFGFTEEQEVSFKLFADKHHKKMQAIREEQNKLVPRYFEDLVQNVSDSKKEETLIKFKELEQEKLEVTYQHFEEIKGMLNKEQEPHFQEFMHRVLKRISSPSKKNPPPPKGFE